MLRGIKIEKFANRDEQEVRGYYELLEMSLIHGITHLAKG